VPGRTGCRHPAAVAVRGGAGRHAADRALRPDPDADGGDRRQPAGRHDQLVAGALYRTLPETALVPADTRASASNPAGLSSLGLLVTAAELGALHRRPFDHRRRGHARTALALHPDRTGRQGRALPDSGRRYSRLAGRLAIYSAST